MSFPTVDGGGWGDGSDHGSADLDSEEEEEEASEQPEQSEIGQESSSSSCYSSDSDLAEGNVEMEEDEERAHGEEEEEEEQEEEEEEQEEPVDRQGPIVFDCRNEDFLFLDPDNPEVRQDPLDGSDLRAATGSRERFLAFSRQTAALKARNVSDEALNDQAAVSFSLYLL